jgi:hypothetical protein
LTLSIVSAGKTIFLCAIIFHLVFVAGNGRLHMCILRCNEN